MKISRCLNLIFVFLISFKLSSCQKYAPGYDFELFRNTPAHALAKAVEKEDTTRIVRLVTKELALVNFKEHRFGNSLLTLAIINNKNLATVKLLDLGANPNLRSLSDRSPFLEACFNSSDLKAPKKTLLMLLKYGAEVNAEQFDVSKDQFGNKKNFKTTALGILCVYGNLESVKTLVENGAKLDTYSNNEGAILTTAVLSGKLDIAQYLMIERKAPIPDYCVIRQPGGKYEKKMTITDILNEKNYVMRSGNPQLKQTIIDYLREQGKK